MKKKYFNWEDLGLGTIEQLSKDWGIPVEELEKDQYKKQKKLSKKEFEKRAEFFLEFGKYIDDIIETINSGRMGEGDLEDAIASSDLEEIS